MESYFKIFFSFLTFLCIIGAIIYQFVLAVEITKYRDNVITAEEMSQFANGSLIYSILNLLMIIICTIMIFTIVRRDFLAVKTWNKFYLQTIILCCTSICFIIISASSLTPPDAQDNTSQFLEIGGYSAALIMCFGILLALWFALEDKPSRYYDDEPSEPPGLGQSFRSRYDTLRAVPTYARLQMGKED